MTDEQRNIECTKLLTIVHELDRMIRADHAHPFTKRRLTCNERAHIIRDGRCHPLFIYSSPSGSSSK